MVRKIDVSIVIPAYNEEKYLPVSLGSIKKQKTGLNYEVIVVDNNSVDKTSYVARKFGAKVFKEKRQGVGRARKTGTEKAKGFLVVNIDADTKLPQNYIEKAWSFFQKDKKLVCLGGQFSYYDAPLWKELLRSIFYLPLCCFAILVSRGGVGPTGGNMVFKRNAYFKTNGFNPHLKFGEDGDLTIQLKKVGKVRVKMALKCQVSARRFSIDGQFFMYVVNFLYLCFRGRPYKNVLPSTKTK